MRYKYLPDPQTNRNLGPVRLPNPEGVFRAQAGVGRLEAFSPQRGASSPFEPPPSVPRLE